MNNNNLVQKEEEQVDPQHYYAPTSLPMPLLPCPNLYIFFSFKLLFSCRTYFLSFFLKNDT